MRSSSRPGPWRPVRAFAWWGRALSGTTAILPPRFRVGAGPARGSSARCPGSARSGTARLFCWSGGGRRRRTGTSSTGPRTALVRCPLSGAACGGSRPRAPSGLARMVSGSCFRTRTGSTASRFPACPAGTQHILVARQSAGHSCTVLSARSTIPAMTPASTPREACRTASAFIPASTRLPERLLHPTRTAVSSGATPTRTPPPHPKQHRKPTKNTVPFHAGHRAGVIKSFE